METLKRKLDQRLPDLAVIAVLAVVIAVALLSNVIKG